MQPLLLILALLASTYTADELAHEAMRCANYTASKAPEATSTVRMLLDTEQRHGWPARLRGGSVAAACNESGYVPTTKGDGGRSHGLLQLGGTLRRHCGLDDGGQFDAARNAECWIKRVAYIAKTKARRCPKPWLTAWHWVAAGPGLYGCTLPRKHLRHLHLWRMRARTARR